MKRPPIMLACLACLLVAMPGMAQEPEPGKDHPLVPRFPGYVMNGYEELEFGSFEFAGPEDSPEIKAEGRFWKISYAKKDEVKSPGGVALGRNYRNAILNKGGKILHDRLDNEGGIISGVLTSNGRKVYLQVNTGDAGGWYDVIIVQVTGLEQKVELSVAELAEALNERGFVAVHGILFDTGKATIKPESAGRSRQSGSC